jgi:pimeloyl-ACP methyl ester carboxylesterase
MQGQWIQHPQQNKTVIFVHGILSSSESGWTYKKGVFWFKKSIAWFNLLKEEAELKDLGIYTFSYKTGIFSGTYSLNDVVTAFKEHLKLDKVLQPNKQLIFVCHSMGGIVVRKFIVERQTELINLNLQIGLFLVASPSLGSDYANLINGFAKKLKSTQADALRFNQNNIWLNDLDNQFMNFKEARYLPLIGKELIEDKFVIKKLFFIPQIVEPFSGARYFGEHLRVADSDHFSIAKPKDKKAEQHRLLCEFIKDFDTTIENNFPKKAESNNTIAEQSIEQSVTYSTADNIVCAEQITDSFKTEIHHHHYAPSESKLLSLDSMPEVDTYHLPKPTTALIGRKTELAGLTEAFTNGKTRLAIIVAAGGIGKSALTDEWLTQIAQENYYGKTRVFGWSFYAQGTHTTYTNSQEFFNKVLPFLGISDIPKDEIEKARLLARCLQHQPCLLILDGLEPLQYAQNLQSMNGDTQDSALKEFIACFRQTAGKSFVLFSSRQPLVELKKWQTEHYLSLPLETLPHEDGAAVLQALGVTGKAAERQAISQDLNGHALSLVLFGHLLVEHHQGDPRYSKELNRFPLYQRGTEGDLEISPNPSFSKRGTNSDAEKDSRHALRVLASR